MRYNCMMHIKTLSPIVRAGFESEPYTRRRKTKSKRIFIHFYSREIQMSIMLYQCGILYGNKHFFTFSLYDSIYMQAYIFLINIFSRHSIKFFGFVGTNVTILWETKYSKIQIWLLFFNLLRLRVRFISFEKSRKKNFQFLI